MFVVIEDDLLIAESAALDIVPRMVARLALESQAGTITLSATARGGKGDLARIEVPVILETNAASLQRGQTLTLSVRARSASHAFPLFDGTIGLSSAEPACTHVVLRGTYIVPLGMLGAAVNAVAFEGIAQGSLRRLLSLVIERVDKYIAEESDLNYRATRHR